MGIGKLLFLLYFFSFLLGTMLLCIYALLTQGDPNDIRVFYMMVAGGLFINFPLLFISAPGILMSASFFNNNRRALIACFTTPILILLIIVSGLAKLQSGDIEAYAIIVLSFILVLGYFFVKKLTPNNIPPSERSTD
jgi:hypothetical protein